MGFSLGSIGNFIKPLAQTAFKSAVGAIAPQVTQMLQKVAGDVFTKGASALSGLASSLPGPLGNFAQGLISKFAPGLLNQAQSAIQNFINQATQRITARDDGTGNQIATPTMAGRGNTAQVAQAAVTAAAATAAGSTSSAATAASSTGAGSTVGASYSSFSGTQDINIPPMPSSQGLNLKDPNVMAKYQEDMQFYTQMVQLRSKIAEMLHDTRKTIIQSMRA